MKKVCRQQSLLLQYHNFGKVSKEKKKQLFLYTFLSKSMQYKPFLFFLFFLKSSCPPWPLNPWNIAQVIIFVPILIKSLEFKLCKYKKEICSEKMALFNTQI